jgi:hypothetical protein
MANTARKRGDSPALGELARIGQLTEEQLEIINPYFDEFKQALHDLWEKCPLDDGARAKTLHFHLRTVNELQRLMKVRVSKGKQALNKLGDQNG